MPSMHRYSPEGYADRQRAIREVEGNKLKPGAGGAFRSTVRRISGRLSTTKRLSRTAAAANQHDDFITLMPTISSEKELLSMSTKRIPSAFMNEQSDNADNNVSKMSTSFDENYESDDDASTALLSDVSAPPAETHELSSSATSQEMVDARRVSFQRNDNSTSRFLMNTASSDPGAQYSHRSPPPPQSEKKEGHTFTQIMGDLMRMPTIFIPTPENFAVRSRVQAEKAKLAEAESKKLANNYRMSSRNLTVATPMKLAAQKKQERKREKEFKQRTNNFRMSLRGMVKSKSSVGTGTGSFYSSSSSSSSASLSTFAPPTGTYSNKKGLRTDNPRFNSHMDAVFESDEEHELENSYSGAAAADATTNRFIGGGRSNMSFSFGDSEPESDVESEVSDDRGTVESEQEMDYANENASESDNQSAFLFAGDEDEEEEEEPVKVIDAEQIVLTSADSGSLNTWHGDMRNDIAEDQEEEEEEDDYLLDQGDENDDVNPHVWSGTLGKALAQEEEEEEEEEEEDDYLRDQNSENDDVDPHVWSGTLGKALAEKEVGSMVSAGSHLWTGTLGSTGTKDSMNSSEADDEVTSLPNVQVQVDDGNDALQSYASETSSYFELEMNDDIPADRSMSFGSSVAPVSYATLPSVAESTQEVSNAQDDHDEEDEEQEDKNYTNSLHQADLVSVSSAASFTSNTALQHGMSAAVSFMSNASDPVSSYFDEDYEEGVSENENENEIDEAQDEHASTSSPQSQLQPAASAASSLSNASPPVSSYFNDVEFSDADESDADVEHISVSGTADADAAAVPNRTWLSPNASAASFMSAASENPSSYFDDDFSESETEAEEEELLHDDTRSLASGEEQEEYDEQEEEEGEDGELAMRSSVSIWSESSASDDGENDSKLIHSTAESAMSFMSEASDPVSSYFDEDGFSSDADADSEGESDRDGQVEQVQQSDKLLNKTTSANSHQTFMSDMVSVRSGSSKSALVSTAAPNNESFMSMQSEEGEQRSSYFDDEGFSDNENNDNEEQENQQADFEPTLGSDAHPTSFVKSSTDIAASLETSAPEFQSSNVGGLGNGGIESMSSNGDDADNGSINDANGMRLSHSYTSFGNGMSLSDFEMYASESETDEDIQHSASPERVTSTNEVEDEENEQASQDLPSMLSVAGDIHNGEDAFGMSAQVVEGVSYGGEELSNISPNFSEYGFAEGEYEGEGEYDSEDEYYYDDMLSTVLEEDSGNETESEDERGQSIGINRHTIKSWGMDPWDRASIRRDV